MNRKDRNRLKKSFTEECCPIQAVYGAFVSLEKECVMLDASDSLRTDDNAAAAMADIFKKVLSGKDNSTSFDLDFKSADGGSKEWKFFNGVKEKIVHDSGAAAAFFRRVAENYPADYPYVIMLARCFYEIPDKKNGDSYTFEYMISAVCKVRQDKEGLAAVVKPAKGMIRNKLPNMTICAPVSGFVFPAYEDNGANLNRLLYFEKNPGTEDYIADMVGIIKPKTQEEEYEAVSGAMIEERCTVDDAVSIIEKMEEEAAAEGVERLDSVQAVTMIRTLPMQEEKKKAVTEALKKLDGMTLKKPGDKISVSAPGIEMRLAAEKKPTTAQIDGKTYICVPVDSADTVTVNGIAGIVQ